MQEFDLGNHFIVGIKGSNIEAREEEQLSDVNAFTLHSPPPALAQQNLCLCTCPGRIVECSEVKENTLNLLLTSSQQHVLRDQSLRCDVTKTSDDVNHDVSAQLTIDIIDVNLQFRQ